MASSAISEICVSSVALSFGKSKSKFDMDTSDSFKLHSSGGTIEVEAIGKLRPTYLDTPLQEIQKRYNEDGYVWLKGLLPPEDVWETRKNYFEFLAPTGLIKQGTDPKDGVYCGGDWHLVSRLSSSPFNFQGNEEKLTLLPVDATWKTT